ncbi:MAG TPA: hypothetical protein VGK16_12110 [Candidatus Limnocylindrales bacterium]|jgi:hypothetical protein
MPMIDVRCAPAAGGWTCDVTVDDGVGRPTAHVVTVAAADLARFAPEATDPKDLLTRSFEFLLEREPKSSILRRFDLRVIARYFPEYERTIRG